jgi:hypothetical protein
MTSDSDFADSFKEIPPFLEILGFKGAKLIEDDSFVCDFSPSVDLTHSNGMIVQGWLCNWHVRCMYGSVYYI